MQITYLFDPLCGWCYGAHPMLEQIADQRDLALVLAPVGLFAGELARPMDARFAAYAWQNDQRIARLTGQPFSGAYRANVLGAGGGLFDSAPATLGIVAAAIEAPSRELPTLQAIQRARYVDGRDTSDLHVITDILIETGLAEAAQRIQQRDEPLIASYRQRITAARDEMNSTGVQDVPALIAGEDTQRRVLPSDILFNRTGDLRAVLSAATA